MRSLDVLLLVGLIAPALNCVRVSMEGLLIDSEMATPGHFTASVDSQHGEVGEIEEADIDESGDHAAAGGKVGLIVVDVQECFTEHGVGLGSPRGGSEYKTRVNSFVEKVRKAGGAIALLQDYHPEEHISFGNVAKQDPDWKWNPVEVEFWKGKLCKDALNWDNSIWYGTDQVDKDSLKLDFDQYLPMKGSCETDGAEIMQPLFPAHCVQETEEVNHISGLCESAGGKSEGDTCIPGSNKKLKIIRKGMNPGIDSFGGAHDNRILDGLLDYTNERAHWGLLKFFEGQGVEHVIHIGIADDFCVKQTAFAVTGVGKSNYSIKSASVVPELTFGIFQQLADREDTGVANFGPMNKSDDLIKEYEKHDVVIESEAAALGRLQGRRSSSGVCCKCYGDQAFCATNGKCSPCSNYGGVADMRMATSSSFCGQQSSSKGDRDNSCRSYFGLMS